ncbi:GAF domain-containing SpoIIE family protein phosphatase [Kutzneria kofuensis]|uniref:Serine phosphatase RsbU (Regulator of sigma subunit) n=1 Tax=Kutzneria kofuensis TaxID=103725 RepID=A0A7W9NFG1_9PSEU|nr:SpoIIE family protein phosphatase [Kutzneria kofuensis]MBB5891352.1 serine phosphatase RsbU (regulator of sigma subunit) [Kutzneria kofuensis]
MEDTTPVRAGADAGRLARTVDRLRQEIRRAEAAADGRALIELAKGVLVERLRCGPQQAAEQLAALAEESGQSLLELAVQVINKAADDRLSAAAQQLVQPEDDDRQAPVRLRTAESGAAAAADAQQVAEALLAHALRPLGATTVAIWAAAPDGSLALSAYAGIAPTEAHRWRHVPPGVATPARRALLHRDIVWFGDLGESGLPSVATQDSPAGGRVVCPVGSGGRIIGVLEVGWPQPVPPQPPRIERQIEALAQLCASTLDAGTRSDAVVLPAHDATELIDLADGIMDPALVLGAHLDSAGALADFRILHANRPFQDPAGRPRGAVVGSLLVEAYPVAAGEGGLFDKVEHVYATGEPFRADKMVLTTLVDQIRLTSTAAVSITRQGHHVLLIWRIQDESARLASLLHHAQRLGRVGGFEENLLTGEVTWHSEVFALHGLPPSARPVPLGELGHHVHPDDTDGIGRLLRTVLHHRRSGSAAFRLHRRDGVARHIRVIVEPVLGQDNRPIGVRGAYQDISAQHWTEVALAATQDQLAHAEQQAAERNRLALQLQRAIMPAAQGPIDAFGLHIAVRYRPAESENLVGGDWYDAVVLPSKQVLLSVGDIAGHGITAATGMVMLRNALRGLATTGAGPAQLLSWLNQVAHHLTDHVLATAVCALYDPRTRVLRWARAGHLPPLLVRRQEATTLPMIRGLMLGARAEADYEEAEVQLELDDVLVLYTDGLVERKGHELDDSLQQLLETAQRSHQALEQRLDHMLTHSNADTDDDTCIVGVQLR